MKPEDLVGRRIRFLPRLAGRTIHAIDDDSEYIVSRCTEPTVNSGVRDGFQVHFERNGVEVYQIARLNVDFEVIDDGGLPYSWRV